MNIPFYHQTTVGFSGNERKYTPINCGCAECEAMARRDPDRQYIEDGWVWFYKGPDLPGEKLFQLQSE